MTRKMLRLFAATLCIFPTALFALGLGDIRLKSALNEPLDAEIELVSATPDELASLRAQLATGETFARYGLERPRFLSALDFRVGRSGDGRNVLFVRSRESVTEPFLTFLIEVNWSRGRLLREYTLLLDPPVYMPGAEEGASAPVSAPQTSAEENARAGAVERPTEPEAVAPAPAPAVSRPSPTISPDAGSYTVRDNDTLWQIASGLKPGARSDINRMMIALFQANPEAFRSNINRLKSGAILRIPSDTEFDSMAATDAAAEVRRQTAEWRESRGLTAAAEGADAARLRLVTPTEGGEGTGTAATPPSETTAPTAQPGTSPAAAPSESGRIAVTDAELARLQQQPGQPPATTTPVAPEAPPAAAPGAETPPVEQPIAAEEPEPTPSAEPPAPAPKPAAVPAEEEPGLLDWVLDKWLFILGALILLGGIIVYSMRRREPDSGALGRLAKAEEAVREMHLDHREREPSPGSTTASMRAPRPKEDAFLVEESGEHQAPRTTRTSELPRVELAPRAEPVRSKADQTLSSETAINLDQGDPLAEADFHMAYGLYDQAADLVRIAIEREPQRRDLKLKLLEIFFVWGNKDAFLQTARQLHDSRGKAPAGEWDKIAIMGRQIAPEDPLFGQGTGGGPVGDVDLNLEGGENRVDLDLLGPPEGEGGGGIDLDLGGVLSGEDDTAITGESQALRDDEGLDFVLEDTRSGRGASDSATTREMAARTQETPTIETAAYGSDSPTVESPTLRERGSSTIKEKIDSALFRKDAVSPEQTAELALDDLGLDLDSLRGAEDAALDDDGGDHPADAATMVAGMDEKSRRLLAEADARTREMAMREEGKQTPTGTWVLDDKTLAATMALPGADTSDTARMRGVQSDAKSDTARRKKLDADSTAELARLSADDMDLDLDRLEQALKGDTAKQQRKGSTDEDRFSTDVFSSRAHDSTDLDVDVGDIRRNRDRAPTATSRIPGDEMSLPELEPVTMSEVGTKLDLARAYMDMGDPEGARSILDEVLQEGSATQKQEAQRLIDSLPG